MCLLWPFLWLELNYAAAQADGDGLGAIGGAQFFHDVLDVNLDGFFRDEEALGDFAVTISTGYFLQHLDLAVRENLVAHVFEKLRSDLGWNPFLARVNLADHVEQLGWRHVLQQVAACSCL